MYFSSMTFLWIFLPATLLLYLLAERFQRIALENFVLLSASLIFYAWGEPFYIFLLLFSVLMNYVFGRLLEAERPRFRKWILACGVLSNLGLLAFFKYFNFFAGYINRFLGQDAVPLSEFTLPLGISFYTFQAMSYVIDVYRKEVTAQRNFFSLLLYISLFPQLVAGPIVKYKDIEEQIKYRTKTDAKRAYGVKRFIYGLGKKVLISNVMGKYVDMVLAFETKQLSTGLMWLVMIMYAFQIYYDFSGYSDMAIGLGSMFGFDFKENFHYPYISKSVREFWTRWHISLSTWFKEYVYIPLGGNRNGKWRTYRNLFLVFLLTGFWHGAGLNFVFWGIFHGCFMVLERIGFGKLLEKNPFKIFNHIYMAVTVVCIWTLFRIESMKAAGEYLKGMFIYQRGEYNLFSCINPEIILLLVTAFLLCGVLQTAVPRLKEALYQKEKVSAVESVGLLAILLLCVVTLSSNSYNPFIYFRF
jgi:alginate O-acetyltransferase complex protein AlgI